MEVLLTFSVTFLQKQKKPFAIAIDVFFSTLNLLFHYLLVIKENALRSHQTHIQLSTVEKRLRNSEQVMGATNPYHHQNVSYRKM